jgi:hypothetical protein
MNFFIALSLCSLFVLKLKSMYGYCMVIILQIYLTQFNTI